MLICLDMRTGAGCGARNENGARECKVCQKGLRFALALHDAGAFVENYRVVRLIGHGGAGAVYEVEEIEPSMVWRMSRPFPALARHVWGSGQTKRPWLRLALKETFDEGSINSFQREFMALNCLEHANLPRYYKMFAAEGRGYLVMELVPGQSLQEILDEGAAFLPESQVLGYALQLCDVLDYLHNQYQPILHRDIKPANIRLTPEGRIKLVDFGLLKQGWTTIRGLGTLAYAPLEQYGQNEEATNPRTDIYSLGATLYHLLTGQEPLSAPDRLGAADPLRAVGECRPDLSPHVAQAVMTAMSLLPQDRFENAAQFKNALLTSSTAPTPSPSPNTRGGERLPSPSIGGGAGGTTRRPQVIETPVPPVPSVTSPFQSIKKRLKQAWLAGQEAYEEASPPSEAPAPASTASLRPTAPASRPDLVEAVDHMSLPHLIWNVPSRSSIQHLAFGPNGAFLAGAGENNLYLWEVANGQLIRTIKGPPKAYHRFHAIAYSPDGKTIAAGGDDKIVRVWRTRDGLLLHELGGQQDAIQSVAYSPDGQSLAGAGGKTIHLWQLTDGSLQRVLNQLSPVSSVAFRADGLMMASGSATSGSHTIRLWRTQDGKQIGKLKEANNVTSLAWSPDGQLLISGSHNKKVSVWRVIDGQQIKTLSGHTKSIASVAWSPDGQTFASGSSDNTVRIWSAADYTLRHICQGHEGIVTSIAYNPTGRQIASASWDKTVRLWQWPVESVESKY